MSVKVKSILQSDSEFVKDLTLLYGGALTEVLESPCTPGVRQDIGAAAIINNLAGASHLSTLQCGWWDDLETGKPAERNVFELLALAHSELSEALEAARKDLNDDHIPARKGIEVELADLLHRVFDLSAAMDLDIGGAFVEKLIYNRQRSDHKIANRKLKNGKKA